MKPKVCVKVPKNFGEKAVTLAGKLGLIDKSLTIIKQDDDLFIPIIKQPEKDQLTKLTEQIPTLRIATNVFKEKNKGPPNLAQVLQKKLPANLLAKLPQSFDIIGDIVIVEIPPELENYNAIIGQAILETHKNIKTVLAKAGEISGVYRIRDYNFLAGEKRTKTVHREFGCQFNVDVAKAYFSPRLSHEHERVASIVTEDEIVVDLFAGVGPFSVLIGKKKPHIKVYAADLNPEAVELLKENIKANKLSNRVVPLLANAQEIAKGELQGVADRVIMNLPETAINFVGSACSIIKPEGGIIHFYGFLRKPDSIEQIQEQIKLAVEKTGRRVEAFLYSRSIRETAPFESQIVLDIKIN